MRIPTRWRLPLHCGIGIGLILVCTTLAAGQSPIRDGEGSAYAWGAAAAQTPGLPEWAPVPVLAGERVLLPVVRACLDAPLAADRQRAALTVAFVGDPAEAPRLRPLLAAPDRLTRIIGGIALCMLGDSQGIAAARAAFGEVPEWLRFYAIAGLWRVDTPSSRAALGSLQGHETPFLDECLRRAVAARPVPMTPASGGQHGLIPPTSPEHAWAQVITALNAETEWWWHGGGYDECIRCAETMVFFDPTDVEVYASIGWLQWSMGRHGAAVSTYHRAIAANPGSWEAAQELGEYYRLQHRQRLAERYYRRAAELGSPAVQRRQLGHVLEALRRTDDAIAVWRDILAMDPNDPVARRQLQRLGAAAAD